MRSHAGVAIVVAGFLLTGLAACAPAAPSGTPTTLPTSPSTKLSTPTPAPTQPALSQLELSANGLGYLAVGQPVQAMPDLVAIVRFDPTKCVNAAVGIAAGSPGAGAWLPNYPNGASSLGDRPPFDVGQTQSETAPIGEIEVWSPLVRTAAGIGVTSTVRDLTAAYGSQLSVDRADNSDVYVLKGSQSELLFEVAKTDSGLAADEIGTVVWIRVVPLGSTYLHIANTDAAGFCPE